MDGVRTCDGCLLEQAAFSTMILYGRIVVGGDMTPFHVWNVEFNSLCHPFACFNNSHLKGLTCCGLPDAQNVGLSSLLNIYHNLSM